MKYFWLIIGTLVALTVGVMLFKRPSPTPAPTSPPRVAASTTEPPKPAISESVKPPAPAPSVAAPSPTPSPAAPALSPDVSQPQPATQHNAHHNASAAPTASAATPPLTSPPPSPPPPPAPATEPKATEDKMQSAAPAVKSDSPAAKPDAPGASGAAPSGDAGKFTLGPPTKVQKEDDGWTRVDDRFLVKGAGTAEDPMLVPWELLVSASETYRPRTGLKEMPRRVADLKGKHVKITGYVLFPLMGTGATELLLMRNQWDGCCIGVPPTPYDAVEVKLKEAADRKDAYISYVSVEGVLDVDPYVNRDFLLGLFTMDRAQLVQPAKDKDRGL